MPRCARNVLYLVFLVVICWQTVTAFGATKAVNLIDKIARLRVIGKDEQVVFFPTSCYQQGNTWVVPIHGWIFCHGSKRKAFGSLLSSAFYRNGAVEGGDEEDELAVVNPEEEVLKEVKSDSARKILKRRLHPFIVDNHRRRKITIRVGDMERELPARSRKNGHFHAHLRFTEDEIASVTSDGKIHYEAVTGLENDSRVIRGTSLLVPPKGLSVISDIDDTVKISQVLEKKKLIRNTFLKEFESVPGMAQLYQKWKKEHNAAFHFVSSSPWQLYRDIASFFERDGFPEACFHLKSIRLKDRTLLDLFADPMESKLNKISGILETYPHRGFVLVGDTGERDPEVYGEICRRYPGQVKRVFLRDVTSDLSEELVRERNKKEEKKKSGIVINGPHRFEDAFTGVPDETWSLFKDASTIDLCVEEKL